MGSGTECSNTGLSPELVKIIGVITGWVSRALPVNSICVPV